MIVENLMRPHSAALCRLCGKYSCWTPVVDRCFNCYVHNVQPEDIQRRDESDRITAYKRAAYLIGGAK